MRIISMFFLAIVLMASKCPSDEAKTCTPLQAIHVKAGASGGDGKTWATAFGNLQDAIDAAQTPSTAKVLIAVAEGEYRPDPKLQVVETLATAEDLRNIEIRGGFAGVDDCVEDHKPELESKTIFSGKYIKDGIEKHTIHVLRLEYKSPGAANVILNGFVVRDGQTLSAAPDVNNDPQVMGGGLLVIGGEGVQIERVSFKNNSAVNGGGLAAINSNGIGIKDSTFEDNSAVHGGAIMTQNSNLTISGGSMARNRANATNGMGGAICQTRKGSLTVDSNATFTGNTAFFGGSISIDDAHAISFKDVTFTRNAASPMNQGLGGAIYLGFPPPFSLDSVLFDQNQAFSGGAIYVNQVNLNIRNSRFLKNAAHQQGFGGAIRARTLSVNSGKFRLDISQNSVFEDNQAGSGGAIWVEYYNLAISGSAFRRNKAQSNMPTFGEGGAIYNGNQKASGFGDPRPKTDIQNTEFRENKASVAGAAIFNFNSGVLTLRTQDQGKFSLNQPNGNQPGFNGLENQPGAIFNMIP